MQQQIQEVFKNQQEQLNIQLLQQKNAGIVSQEVTFVHYSIIFISSCIVGHCGNTIINTWIGGSSDSIIVIIIISNS